MWKNKAVVLVLASHRGGGGLLQVLLSWLAKDDQPRTQNEDKRKSKPLARTENFAARSRPMEL